jgi:hypothetical protein
MNSKLKTAAKVVDELNHSNETKITSVLKEKMGKQSNAGLLH